MGYVCTLLVQNSNYPVGCMRALLSAVSVKTCSKITGPWKASCWHQLLLYEWITMNEYMWKEEFYSYLTGDLQTFSLFCSHKVSISLIPPLIVGFVITSSLLLNFVPSILDFSCNSCHPSKLFTILSSVPLPFSSPSLLRLEPNLCQADDPAAGGDNSAQKWKMYSIRKKQKKQPEMKAAALWQFETKPVQTIPLQHTKQ